ncbi:MAG: SDR family NAD(P)-dependent oxidoreductase [Pseudomonadales bacterium]|jgi:3-oxoacyl-[acyl-carrier protein] reductase|nr:SDR family NAD(P)-dependent oxidoreductase [Pseudomonadales bacterium]
MDLKNRVALVTGASGDIGGAIARCLAENGAQVILTYVGAAETAAKLETEIGQAGGNAWAVQLDQRDPEAIEAVMAQVEEKYARLDILVNNAAWNIGIPFPNLDDLTADIWDRILETNLRAPFLLARAGAKLLKARPDSHIVNISSAGGISPGSSSIAYSSSKAGLNHLTRCLAVAMAPNVAVNCIAPGLVENTRMAQRLPDNVAQGARNQAVLGRVGQAYDIANQVLTFVTSSSITGQTMVIDGGMPGAMR